MFLSSFSSGGVGRRYSCTVFGVCVLSEGMSLRCGTINADFRLIIGITAVVAVGNVSPFFECGEHKHGEIIIEKCRRGRLIDMVNNIERDHAIERSNARTFIAQTQPSDRLSAKMT